MWRKKPTILISLYLEKLVNFPFIPSDLSTFYFDLILGSRCALPIFLGFGFSIRVLDVFVRPDGTHFMLGGPGDGTVFNVPSIALLMQRQAQVTLCEHSCAPIKLYVDTKI